MPSATWGCFSVVPFSGPPCLGLEALQKLYVKCVEADGISHGTLAEMFGVTFWDRLAHLAHSSTADASSWMTSLW